ncbi:MAG TPA: hypothetical protein VG937_38170 [Polyangiaceae bacterium]|jgi:hypothetical protein|nr:hypothetical protein [Polyangiaceae bacterium]
MAKHGGNGISELGGHGFVLPRAEVADGAARGGADPLEEAALGAGATGADAVAAAGVLGPVGAVESMGAVELVGALELAGAVGVALVGSSADGTLAEASRPALG